MTTTAPGAVELGPDPAFCVVELSACGDAAVRVTVRGPDDEIVWNRVHDLARVLNGGGIPGILSAVPTYDAILVEFDPYRCSLDEMRRRIREADVAPAAAVGRASRLVVVPTAFGGRHGTDLEWVAEAVGLTASEVVERFCAEDRVVRCLGDPAASAMMDGPALGRPIPRLADPRLRVPAGAVSLAGRQAVLGPVAAPSGWRQIGVTPLQVLGTGRAGVDRSDIVPYGPGDRLRFVPIDEAGFDALASRWLEVPGV